MNPTILEFPYTTTTTVILDDVPGAYEISKPNMQGQLVCITHIKTGERVYFGPGPVEVYESPAPF